MGLKPVDKQKVPGSSWEWSPRDYQNGTKRLNPWSESLAMNRPKKSFRMQLNLLDDISTFHPFPP
jgi:hypothetical protein